MCYFHESPHKDGRTRMCVCVCSCLRLSCKSQRKPFSVNHCQLLWQWHTARLWYNHRWMTFHTSVCAILRALLCMCIILCVIIFSFPDLSYFESYIYKTGAFSECVPVCMCLPVCSDSFLWLCARVCMCVRACALLAQKVSFVMLPSGSSNHSHLYFLFSPYISSLPSWNPWAPDMDGICHYSLYVPAMLLLPLSTTFHLLLFWFVSCVCEP